MNEPGPNPSPHASSGQHFIVMNFVEGPPPLSRVISELQYTMDDFRRITRWMKAIAEAVHDAHERGILHRDLKPSNILLGPDDQPRVTDFGLAKKVESSSELRVERGNPARGETSQLSTQDPLNSLTRTGQPLGSPGFMPPEQAEGDGRRIGPASDVYGLGAILYHLLTGRPPFLADTFEATLRQVLDRDPIPPCQFNPNVPADLETICLKCLEKEPAKRYATAQALADELSRFLKDEPIHARPVRRVEKVWRWCRRKPALAASFSVILLLLLLVLIGSPISAYRIDRERRRAEQQSIRAETNAANERRERYYASIAAADSHIRNGDIDVALSGLTNCPPEFRHWEWGRLLYLGHQSIATTKLPASNLDAVIVNAEGTRSVAAPLVAVSARRTVCWDTKTGQKLFEVATATNSVTARTFSPDGQRLAVAHLNGLVTVWDSDTGRERSRCFAGNQVYSLQFDAQGERLSVTVQGQRGFLVDTHSGRVKFSTPDRGTRFRASKLDPTGRTWVTMDEDGALTVRDAQTGEPRFTFQGHADINPMRYHKGSTLLFSPDGTRLIAHTSPQSARVWNVETGRELVSIPSKVQGAAFTPDGSWVVIHSGGKTAELWDLTTGKKRKSLPGHRQRVNFVGFDREGRYLRTADTDGGRDLIQHPYFADGLAFRPDGERFVTTQFDGLAKIWETASDRELLAFRGNWSWLRSASFSPDGKRIVTGGEDRMARIFEADTGRELLVMRGHISGRLGGD